MACSAQVAGCCEFAISVHEMGVRRVNCLKSLCPAPTMETMMNSMTTTIPATTVPPMFDTLTVAMNEAAFDTNSDIRPPVVGAYRG